MRSQGIQKYVTLSVSENCASEDKYNSKWFVMLCKSTDINGHSTKYWDGKHGIAEERRIVSVQDHFNREFVIKFTGLKFAVLYKILKKFFSLALENFVKVSMLCIRKFDSEPCARLNSNNNKIRSVIVHETGTRLNYGLFDTAHSLFIG